MRARSKCPFCLERFIPWATDHRFIAHLRRGHGWDRPRAEQFIAAEEQTRAPEWMQKNSPPPSNDQGGEESGATVAGVAAAFPASPPAPDQRVTDRHRFDGWYFGVGRSGGKFWLCTCGYREATTESRTTLSAEHLLARHVESLDISGLPSMQELLTRVSSSSSEKSVR